MAISFEAGAIFRIIDEATPILARLSRRMAEFDDIIKATSKNLLRLGDVPLTGLSTRIDELIAQSKVLTDSYGKVAAAATTAGRAASVAGGGGIGYRPPGIPVPGGGHFHGGIAAIAGAGALAYGAYEEGQFEDAAFRAMYTAGIPADPAERARRMKQLRDIIQTATTTTGKPIGDVEEATLTGIRQFAGMPWDQRLKILPDLLAGAAAESVLKGKGTTVEEGMEVFTGLAHMTKEYSLEGIKKLIPVFAYLSTVDPEKIKQMQRASSYAVPILQSALEIDPTQTLLLVAALQRAGVTNTKSGTWIRSMAINAMPGTRLMSKKLFEAHEEALRAFGLVDTHGKPTWFTDGKPDIIKMLDIAGTNAAKIPLTMRSAYEMALFGSRGAGAMAVLSDPKVLAQVHILEEQMKSFKTGLDFFKQYEQDSPLQKFRTSWSDLQKVLMDIGTTALPPVVTLLQGLDAGLKGLNKTLGSGVMATIISAGVGALAGARFGPTGALLGGSAGAILPHLLNQSTPAGSSGFWHFLGFGKGGIEDLWNDLWSHLGKSASSVSAPAQSAASALDKLRDAIESLAGAAAKKAGALASQHAELPIILHSALNVDGRELARATSYHLARSLEHPTRAPYFNSVADYSPPDMQTITT